MGLTDEFGVTVFQSFFRARVAQLVEHYLAKVDVAGSNPVSRSIFFVRIARSYFG